MNKSMLQEAIDQLGVETVQKSITHAGISIGFCDLHGHYGFTTTKSCPACPSANGTDASQVEHYINIREAVGMDGSNPGVKVNPYGV